MMIAAMDINGVAEASEYFGGSGGALPTPTVNVPSERVTPEAVVINYQGKDYAITERDLSGREIVAMNASATPAPATAPTASRPYLKYALFGVLGVIAWRASK